MIEITKSKDGQFFFHVKGRNGAILCHSEGYTRKENCIKAIHILEDVLVNSSGMDGVIYDDKLIDKTNGK